MRPAEAPQPYVLPQLLPPPALDPNQLRDAVRRTASEMRYLDAQIEIFRGQYTDDH